MNILQYFASATFFHSVVAILGALFAILLIIMIHELGHFWMARCCGIKILRFSIGFGKVLWERYDRQGTHYTLCLLPLGGYVKMLGEGHESIVPADQARAFNYKPLWARAAVVFAGPFINFVLAIFLFWIVFQLGVQHIRPVVGRVTPHSIAAEAGIRHGDEFKKIGSMNVNNWQSVLMAFLYHLGDQGELTVVLTPKNSTVLRSHRLNLDMWVVNREDPQLFQSLGIWPYQPKVPAVVEGVEPNSPAALAGFKAQDQIIAINHHPMQDWFAVAQFLQQHPDQAIQVEVKRAGTVKSLRAHSTHLKMDHRKSGYLGVRIQQPVWPAAMMEEKHYSFIKAIPKAAQQTWELILFNAIMLVKMLSAKISLHTLGGPISIFQTAGSASQLGLSAYLSFMAFVSVSLGFINLLPIPCLDGGYLLFFLIEAVLRKPIPERYQALLMRAGLLLIILLMTQAIINDVLKL